MTNVIPEPARYLIRPGQDDHREIERLLTPGYWQKKPVELDGVVMDAMFAHRMGEPLKSDPIRRAFTDRPIGIADRPIQILIDPQAYRLVDGHRRVAAVDALPYSRAALMGDSGRGFRHEDFDDSQTVSRFVKAALGFQRELAASDYIAPSFYVEKPDSPWIDVNRRVLNESIRQAGTFVYATFCGSLTALEDSDSTAAIVDNASAVYVLVSPMDARHESVTKLLRFVDGLERFKAHGVQVLCGRQPAFGLILMALGIGGFDSGIARIESFNYASLARDLRRDTSSKVRGGRSRPVYVSKLMMSIPRPLASKLLDTPGIKSQLNCQGLCCKDNMTDALQSAREHFVWSRLDEVKQLRGIPPSAQTRHVAEKLAGAHQFAKTLQRNFPQERWDFDFLDNWSRVVEVIGARTVRRER